MPLNLIARIDRVYADTKRSSIYDRGYFIKSVPDLIKNFKNVLHTKPLQVRQKSHFAFNTENGKEATFKGYNAQGQKSSNKQKNHCPCGFKAYYHPPFNCTYITGKPAKGNFTPRPKVQKKVEEALKDPKVKAYVDKSIADYKKRVKEREKQSESHNQDEDNKIYLTTFHGGVGNHEDYNQINQDRLTHKDH